MMKILYAIFFLFITFNGLAQLRLHGYVIDQENNPIPGARVGIENTTYGVRTDFSGEFFLELEKENEVIVKISMIGFDDLFDTLNFSRGINVFKFVLIESNEELSTVDIYAEKENIAKEIISNVANQKKELFEQFKSYKCSTYIKTSLVEYIKTESIKKKQKQINFVESFSVTKFKQKRTYSEVILGIKDFSNFAGEGQHNFSVAPDYNPLIPVQSIKNDPNIFFEKVEDGDINLYQNLVDLPNISLKPLVSPISINRAINYKYQLKSVFIEDGQKIWEIGVEPRFSEVPLFFGSLFIIDSLWVIKSIDLSINKNSLEFFSDFNFLQDYEIIDDKWVPVRREFNYSINQPKSLIQGNVKVQHSNYEFNLDYDKREFNNRLMEYDVDAFNRDSTYWLNKRPALLTAEELNYVLLKDSIDILVNSNNYIDSVNRENNKITFFDIIANGVGFKNREKRQDIYINPLWTQFQFWGVGGFRYRPGGLYRKEFFNGKKIELKGFMDYGPRNKDLKGQLKAEYTYLPKHFGSVKVSVGDVYEYVTYDQSIIGLLSTQNLVRKTLIGVSKRYEVINGLYARGSFDFSTRRSIKGMEYGDFADTLISVGLWQLPKPFPTYNVSIFDLELSYRFKQKYILKGNRKLIIGTQFPELSFRYRRGIPGLFGSDVDFHFVEVGASDEIKLSTMGSTNWNFSTGSFLGSNLDEIQFIERKFFRGSDPIYLTRPLKHLQMLDTSFNTVRPYAKVFAMHHFNGALLGKVPLINKLKLETVVGGGALYIKESNYKHVEFYGGLERKFKIRRQLFKFGIYYVSRTSNVQTEIPNLKFRIQLFNSFTNSWGD